MRSTLAVGFAFLVLTAHTATVGQTLEEGLAFARAGKQHEAKGVYEAILKKDSKNAEAHYRLGMIFLGQRLRDVDKAVEHMEEAVEINPKEANYQHGLGAAYGTEAQSAGVFRQAILAPRVKKAFAKAVELNPRHIEAHIGLARYYQQAPGIMGGDMDKAWQEAEIIIGLDEVQGRTFKASLFEKEKKMPEAENEYKTLLGNRPADWKAWRVAGFFYLRHQRTDDAIASFTKYTEMRPDTADSFTRLAQAHIQKKDADRAIALLQKSLTMDRDYWPAVSILGSAYELKGQKKEALETYQRLLAANLTEDQRKNVEKKIKELSN
ncbi:MAG: hypothetical protein A2059_01525 [Ignavibacteria bacterium GWA2_55_25]|nr:MAG: hypothetical protein A2059_01525 [Ignavibacteria bacterium GWA2_55_25]